MIQFEIAKSEVILEYESESGGSAWVSDELRKHGRVTISRVFQFRHEDILTRPPENDEEGEDEPVFRFRLAKKSKGYYQISGRILGIKSDVLFAEEGIVFERKLFVAERNINIFRRIAELRPDGDEIVIGGNREESIPTNVFHGLLAKFPNTGELNRYASARVETVIGDYFDGMRSARDNYEAYLSRRKSTVSDKPLPQVQLLQTEIDKYIYLRDTIKDWLGDAAARSEHDWQKMIIKIILLIFPKYIAVLENVKIADFYSKPGMKVNRFIDLCLVDATGNIDVIEIKKPFANGVLGKARYRDSYVPGRDLSGGVMQAEKYIFHLSKWGVEGEHSLTKTHRHNLPNGMSIRVTNPKAIIIVGRDGPSETQKGLEADQLFDLEVIKRKYANMIDILTYDDLLRRLNNIIESLSRRRDETSSNTSDFP